MYRPVRSMFDLINLLNANYTFRLYEKRCRESACSTVLSFKWNVVFCVMSALLTLVVLTFSLHYMRLHSSSAVEMYDIIVFVFCWRVEKDCFVRASTYRNVRSFFYTIFCCRCVNYFMTCWLLVF